MGLVLFTFSVIFLLVVSGGLLLFYREAMLQRIAAVLAPNARRASLLETVQQTGASLGGVVGRLERLLPKSNAEVNVTRQRLIRAGYREDSAMTTFYGAKVLVPLLLALAATASGLARHSPFLVYGLALGAGFLGPDFWLGRRISKRQTAINRGLPDVLDLLVICIEAGQSLDQATMRTAEELRSARPEITDELSVVVLEQRAGRPRTEAWKHFAERTGVDSVRNMVAVLIQSEQFGTSAAKTLRVHSDTLRVQRRQKVEEQAAKTTIKLVFPLVFFIFPSLFLVTLGPAIIIIIENFHKYFNQ